MRAEPSILHVDMDAFFASVELLRRPELVGKPVVVGGDGPRGVVAAASYEARLYGVHSAMASSRARRLCPDAVFLPGDHALYSEVSRRVMAIFADVTPLVEPLSLDEAFLDIAGAIVRRGSCAEMAATLRQRVLDEERLTCSVGAAPVKFVAKLASEAAKPRPSRHGPVFGSGVVVIEPGEVRGFLDPLPAKALWGVGPATLARLERLGVSTVAELAALPERTLVHALGEASGRHLHRLANGIDDRQVNPDGEAKSISHEETYAHDLFEPARISAELVRMSDAVGARLRRHEHFARTVTLKLRFGDFTTITRSHTLRRPTDSSAEIAMVVRDLANAIDPAAGVRLLGVGVSGFVTEANDQLSFDDLLLSEETSSGPGASPAVAAKPGLWRQAESALDELRGRFGTDVIGPGSTMRGGRIRPKQRGDQAWGPDQATTSTDSSESVRQTPGDDVV
jgi:DNA polymerase IV